jgi:hypothetical protein
MQAPHGQPTCRPRRPPARRSPGRRRTTPPTTKRPARGLGGDAWRRRHAGGARALGPRSVLRHRAAAPWVCSKRPRAAGTVASGVVPPGLIAAARTGRRASGRERDPWYVDGISHRDATCSGQQAERVAAGERPGKPLKNSQELSIRGPAMPRRGRRNVDEPLLLALACGATGEAAAQKAGVSPSTRGRPRGRRTADREPRPGACLAPRGPGVPIRGADRPGSRTSGSEPLRHRR